jgi:hypothetical protein
MKTNIITLALIALLAAGTASAASPRKCVDEDGHVTYSNNRQCETGNRERLKSGTYSSVRSQTIVVHDLVYDDVHVFRKPTVKKIQPTNKTR